MPGLRDKYRTEYTTWANMKYRCQNQNSPQWDDYGGRGIVVCDRWQDFENFLADMGPRPGDKTVDRIDNDGNYEPGNCRWATRKEQAQNRRPRRAYRVRTKAPALAIGQKWRWKNGGQQGTIVGLSASWVEVRASIRRQMSR